MVSKSRDAVKILPHPTFVYTAKFHPNSEEIICTAGYDKVLRIWSISRVGQYGLLVQELQGHMGYVNSICFSFDGLKLYSADSIGSIISWHSNVTGAAYGKGMTN
jgi:jouberin